MKGIPYPELVMTSLTVYIHIGTTLILYQSSDIACMPHLTIK